MRRRNPAISFEALNRATTSLSFTNFPAIIQGFIDRGILPDEIKPRENVFTFEAWRALGRHVKRGEHGVKILTWIPTAAKTNENGEEVRKAGKRPWTAVVFHVSQTEQNEVRP
jgi:hypothetical protein